MRRPYWPIRRINSGSRRRTSELSFRALADFGDARGTYQGNLTTVIVGPIGWRWNATASSPHCGSRSHR